MRRMTRVAIPPFDGFWKFEGDCKTPDLGFTSTCRVRDLWRKTELRVFKRKIALAINWHGAEGYRLSGRQYTENYSALTGAVGPVFDKVD